MTTLPAENLHQVLVDGQWRQASATGAFCAANPATGERLPGDFPISDWSDLDHALRAAEQAFVLLRETPRDAIAGFLHAYADLIEACADEITELANRETALPVEPRLKSGELPRTVGQLRQAAAACVDSTWRMPVVDEPNNLASQLEPLGPVLVIGPNNFPLAFNGVAGGDFATAIAAGCPVIAKAHPLHPSTSRLLAELAHKAAADLPPATIQMLYGMDPQDGLRMAADPRLGAVAFTGSRAAGLKLKRAADEVGKPVFVELSSINPVVILPGALNERFEDIVDQAATSGLMGAGQFCTNPGLLITLAGNASSRFVDALAERYRTTTPTPLFGAGVLQSLEASVLALCQAGAQLVTGGQRADSSGFVFQNTVLRVKAASFLKAPAAFQTEAFGPCTLVVECEDLDQACQLIERLEGNLTGCVYSATDGSEDEPYSKLAAPLTRCVGRLLNDKMPTGVAVSPAMNHGGPFPASGHPHFTSVGIPAAVRRFTRLMSYDNVRTHRMPQALR